MQHGWQSAAEHPVMQDGLQYHIRCKRGDVNRYVLLPGDPDRTDVIAREWDEAHFVANNREHRTWSGTLEGVPITVCSTGMGGPAASIALEELAALGANTFIRVGSCGAIQGNVKCGDLIICSGAMRQDGASLEYVDISYPAVSHYAVTAALVEACERLEVPYHMGVSCTTASFYCGQARPGFGGYTQSSYSNIIEDLNHAGVMDFEMEAATILTMSGIYGLRAGAVFAVVANRMRDSFEYAGIDNSVRAANEAMKILAAWDKAREARGKRYWYPGLLMIK
ncbi:MAG: uridine phosphorylase [Fretibacterium sp.]|nr:uridine phosphorylase [Fretibacterium sp.]